MLKRPMCLIGLAVVLVAYLLMCIMGMPDDVSGRENIREGQDICLTGRVTQKEYKNHQNILYLEKVKFEEPSEEFRKTNAVIAYMEEMPQVKLGSKARIKGRYAPFAHAENEGQFDAADYYRTNGVDFAIKKARVTALSSSYNGWYEMLYQFRERMKAVYDRLLPEKEAGILHALLLGDKSSLDPDIKDLYTRAGIVHILSLSGLHIATAGLCLLKLLRKLQLPLIVASLISGFLILQYGIMTGLQTSTFRALVMFLLCVIAMCLGRTYDLLSGMALAAVLLILENPLYLYHTGFLLSFGAIMGIGLIYPCLLFLVPRGLQKKKLLQSVLISTSIQLATLPVVLNSFFQISLCGILLNLIIVPLMTIVLAAGIIGGLLGLAFDLPGILLLHPCRLILMVYEWLSEAATKLPGSVLITGKPERAHAALYYIVLIAMLAVLTYIKLKHKYQKCRYLKQLRITTFGVMLTTAVLLMFRYEETFAVTMLSVGQGECTIIHGRDVPTILIDGGSTDVGEVGKYRIIPYLKSNRLHQIDTVFISHTDTDHMSGILEILESPESGVRIDRLILPNIGSELQNENYGELIQAAQAVGTGVYAMGCGEAMDYGQGVLFTCLHPSDTTTGDLNENSMVLEMSYVNFKMLFTGDISASVEAKLSDRISDCTVLKVPHHGSRYAGSLALLQKAAPELALISAGRNNSYGHPHEETLQRLSEMPVYITFNTGQIDLLMQDGSLFTRTYLKNDQ